MSCGICLELFDAHQRRPKVLPCGHTYCLTCLHSLPKEECPVDRKVFSGIGNLADNFMLLQVCESVGKSAARFWCSDCGREASSDCLEEHGVCWLEDARGPRAQPRLEALQAGRDALQGLRGQLDLAVGDLEPQAADCHAKLLAADAALGEAGLQLQAALEADEAVFEEARQAAAMGALPRDAACLLAALADPEAEWTLEAPGGAWRGSVRPREDAAARLLLCRLLCDGRLRRRGGREHDAEDSLEELQPDEARQDRAVEVALPPAPRWEERSNEAVLTVQQMAARLRPGCRVGRGRDWLPSWSHDWSAPGTVTRLDGNGYCRVQWDSGRGGGAYYMGYADTFHLKLLSLHAEVSLPEGVKGSPAYLDALQLSTGPDLQAKSELVAGQQLDQVRALVALRCDKYSPWSLAVLEKAAPVLEVLELRAPSAEHVRAAAAMPRLHSLHLDAVTLETLRLALSAPSLRRLEVHCGLAAALPPPGRLPRAPALEWLRVGVYPLAAALALLRAHAGTLRELELVAASDRPYGCPDLARELADCGLAALEKLVLRRDSPQHYCRHAESACRTQKELLWNKFQDRKVNVVVQCNVCDKLD